MCVRFVPRAKSKRTELEAVHCNFKFSFDVSLYISIAIVILIKIFAISFPFCADDFSFWYPDAISGAFLFFSRG